MCVNTALDTEPLTSQEFLNRELPLHLYVEVLRSGQFTMEHWSALLLHALFILKLSSARKDSRYICYATNCIALLTVLVDRSLNTSRWTATHEETRVLGATITDFGDYYRGVPREQVFPALKRAAQDFTLVRNTLIQPSPSVLKW